MILRLVLLLVLAAIVLPTAALAARPKTVKRMKVGQACSMKKEATYTAHHFTCVKGHLRAVKK
jgi:hypothetical protein